MKELRLFQADAFTDRAFSGDRVLLTGCAAFYLDGRIALPDQNL